MSLQKPRVILLAFCFLLSYAEAQVNLVPNPSFETLTNYTVYYLINDAPPWDSLRAGGGGGGIIASPTANIGGTVIPQTARTGTFMASLNYYSPDTSYLIYNWRSYIQAPLLSKLKSNKGYCVTGYFNLMNRDQYSVDELSLYLDDGSISAPCSGCPAIANPQIKSPPGVFFTDTLNWMRVQGTFTANGTESYITIGNHKRNAFLTYSLSYPSAPAVGAEYYVDDVSVIEADLPAFAGRDTVICPGDSVFIGRPQEIGLECTWAGAVTNTAIAGMWVRPANTQTYMVTQNVCGLIKTDTVKVQVKPQYTGGNISLSSNSLTVCPTDSVKLSIGNNPPVSGFYTWLPSGAFTHTSNNSATAVISQPTNFTVNLNYLGQNAFCPFTRSANVSVNVPLYTGSASLTASPGVSCPGDSIVFTLQNAPAGNVKYDWQPTTAYSYTNVSDASAFPELSNSYTLNVISPVTNGFCSFTRTISINFSDNCFNDPQIPNIFTPNGDNINDTWEIKFPYGYSLQELIVYDRWGTLIYERDNLNFDLQGYARIGWDGYTTSGNQCTAGVYFYVMKYTDRKSEIKSIKGNVTLMK